MRALVTGGCGFIGSHLVDLLVARGHHVRILDDLSTGNSENVANPVREGKVEFVQGRVQDASVVASAMEDRSHVFHLAALADIVPSIDSPLTYFDSNVNGTVVVAEAARNAKVEKFVYAASSSCYGIPDEYPTDERAEIRPQYPYALTKWLGEETIRHWGQVYGLPWISLRLFNVYGPRSRTAGTYGAVFGVFLAQKLAGVPMTVVGDGEQSRDFTYVSDIATAFLEAAESPFASRIYNVGTGVAHSINELTSLLGGDVINIPKRPGEPDMTLADTTDIRRELNWSPGVTFQDGVQIMLDNIEFWKNAPVWNPDSIAEATQVWFQKLGPNA